MSDGTPVDLTTAYAVSVEGRSLDRFFNHTNPCLAITVLEQFMRDIAPKWMGENLVQMGSEDISILLDDRDEALNWVQELDRVLPAASARWPTYIYGKHRVVSPYNAYVSEIVLQPDGAPGKVLSWIY